MQTGGPNGVLLHLFLVHLICQISVESTDFVFQGYQTTNQYFLCTVSEDCHDSRSCLTMLSIFMQENITHLSSKSTPMVDSVERALSYPGFVLKQNVFT